MPRRGLVLAIVMLFVISAALRVTGVGTAIAADSVVTSDIFRPEVDKDLAALADDLQQEKQRLENWSGELAEQASRVEQAKRELQETLEEMKAVEAALAARMAQSAAGAERDVEGLTSIYTAMKPKDAAAIFDAMPSEFAAGFISQMDAAAAASILSAMQAEQALALSVVLAGRNAASIKE